MIPPLANNSHKVRLPLSEVPRFPLLVFYSYPTRTQVTGDLAELFEGSFEALDDFLGENVRIGKIVEFFKAFRL